MRYKIAFWFLVLSLILTTVVYAQRQDTLLVHFDNNDSRILSSDSIVMDGLLKARSRFTYVGISGYCDNIGDDRYNDSLSLERVRATRRWLVGWGLPDSIFRQLSPFGKRVPLNNNRDDRQRSLNRRVQIVFTSIIKPGKARASVLPVPPESMPDLAADFNDSNNLAGKKNIVLRNVNFFGDQHVPLPTALFELQQLLRVMREHPGLTIEIQGYICCMQDKVDGFDKDTHTPDLSVQRAKYVYTFLVDGGIRASRMTYKGLGAGHKLYPLEVDERERSLNRRVEIKITSR